MSARLTPRSVCTAGSATARHHMPMPPRALMTTLAARRPQAYRESTPCMVSRRSSTAAPQPPPLNRRPSTADGALRVHIKRVERVAGRHEQAVAIAAAEADVGAAFRQVDMADRLALGIED